MQYLTQLWWLSMMQYLTKLWWHGPEINNDESSELQAWLNHGVNVMTHAQGNCFHCAESQEHVQILKGPPLREGPNLLFKEWTFLQICMNMNDIVKRKLLTESPLNCMSIKSILKKSHSYSACIQTSRASWRAVFVLHLFPTTMNRCSTVDSAKKISGSE